MKGLIYFLIFITANGMAQAPEVPGRMEIGGIKLIIDAPARREIQESVNALTANPKYFNIHVQRARSYFPIIERVFREENVPEDFKYLVLQESALLPDAVSSSDAVGFWQFKDFTALEMGLRVDRTVDERMNIVSSSRAAARYFKKNNERYFDNWIITLMAYQMGPGAAIKAGGEKYKGQNSMTIDRRTYWYIKKYLAHKIAFEAAIEGPTELEFIEVSDGSGKSLDQIAREAGVSSSVVTDYNKWLLRGDIPDDRTYTVLLPVTQNIKPLLASNPDIAPAKGKNSTILRKQAAPSASTSRSYDIANPILFPMYDNKAEAVSGKITTINNKKAVIARRNDRTVTLASRGGISVRKFLRVNDMVPQDLVEEGKIYYLSKKRSKPEAYYHAVQDGEDLWSISQKYGMKLNKLRQRNRIRTKSVDVKTGRILWLRYIRPADVPVEFKKQPEKEKIETIIVKKEKQENSSIQVVDVKKEERPVEKREWSTPNVEEDASVKDVKKQTPSMPAGNDEEEEEVPEVKGGKRILHVVKSGETFYRISNQYEVKVQDILQWNKMKINDPLAIGQELVIIKPSTLPIVNSGTEKPSPESYYVVKSGDTLYGISKKFNISISELKKINDKINDTINPGDRIKVSK